MVIQIELWLKWLLFPGLDLNTRCRYRYLPSNFRHGPIDTLDAGCGNGALSYKAYKLGNRVLGVTYDATQVQKAQSFFSFLNINPERLSFALCNLYDLPELNQKFDQIICAETLEHIKADQLIVQYFYNCLRPGGVLHLCCPYSLHPDNNLGRVDGPEDGGHVRDGYTLENYRSLLTPVGFEIISHMGLGSPLLLSLDRFIRRIRNSAGELFALPLFLLSYPLQKLDYVNPEIPLSLYVQAVKPSEPNKHYR